MPAKHSKVRGKSDSRVNPTRDDPRVNPTRGDPRDNPTRADATRSGPVKGVEDKSLMGLKQKEELLDEELKKIKEETGTEKKILETKIAQFNENFRGFIPSINNS